MAKCERCNDTGVIETGNNDLPCSCPAGDAALFNDAHVLGGAITGAEAKRHFLNDSPEPIHGTIHIDELRSRSRRRVLVVDDDEPNRLFLKQYFEREGFEVREAANGLDGLRIFHSAGDFAFVLSDFAMPRINGVDMLDLILWHKPFQNVLLMTADPSDAKKALKALNRTDVPILMKPFRMREIEEHLEQTGVLKTYGH